MNKTGSEAVAIRRRVSPSTTLNRKYVKRPASSHAKVETADIAPESHPLQVSANEKLQARKATPAQPAKLSAQELKERAIKKALSSTIKSEQETKTFKTRPKLSFGRVVFALTCATVFVFALTYVVNRNISDFSFRVNAMQSGIDATYPKYVPSGYNLVGITSQDGKVTIEFKNEDTKQNLSITEERTAWDLTAFVKEYITPNFENYTTKQKNNLTIYIDNTRAAWIHEGILYEINYDLGALTKSQLVSLADSL